eukprot:CAMPEP_0203896106 /NCGR_PEP_ID=MMETSP0359-20131031/38868_1 /ASSEMBLY_ACC=CAM_ASM_000338 /TAXON_ID=268821 /ORGANISM="Scrippsiella Hangoei, Strain SHTV-5" /LENGTH=800 /DNA_ID=CAMNT_0050818705 /DNA_START=27 /DNA_END=2426 /DNA_ORIENTATION=-
MAATAERAQSSEAAACAAVLVGAQLAASTDVAGLCEVMPLQKEEDEEEDVAPSAAEIAACLSESCLLASEEEKDVAWVTVEVSPVDVPGVEGTRLVRVPTADASMGSVKLAIAKLCGYLCEGVPTGVVAASIGDSIALSIFHDDEPLGQHRKLLWFSRDEGLRASAVTCGPTEEAQDPDLPVCEMPCRSHVEVPPVIDESPRLQSLACGSFRHGEAVSSDHKFAFDSNSVDPAGREHVSVASWPVLVADSEAKSEGQTFETGRSSESASQQQNQQQQELEKQETSALPASGAVENAAFVAVLPASASAWQASILRRLLELAGGRVVCDVDHTLTPVVGVAEPVVVRLLASRAVVGLAAEEQVPGSSSADDVALETASVQSAFTSSEVGDSVLCDASRPRIVLEPDALRVPSEEDSEANENVEIELVPAASNPSEQADAEPSLRICVPSVATMRAVRDAVAEKSGGADALGHFRLVRRLSKDLFVAYKDSDLLGDRRCLLIFGIELAGLVQQAEAPVRKTAERQEQNDDEEFEEEAVGSNLCEEQAEARDGQAPLEASDRQALLEAESSLAVQDAVGLLSAAMELLEHPAVQQALMVLDAKAGGVLAAWEPPWASDGIADLDAETMSKVPPHKIRLWAASFAAVVRSLECAMVSAFELGNEPQQPPQLRAACRSGASPPCSGLTESADAVVEFGSAEDDGVLEDLFEERVQIVSQQQPLHDGQGEAGVQVPVAELRGEDEVVKPKASMPADDQTDIDTLIEGRVADDNVEEDDEVLDLSPDGVEHIQNLGNEDAGMPGAAD